MLAAGVQARKEGAFALCLACPVTGFTLGQHILMAQRQVQVAEEALQDFHRALCCYVDFTGAQSQCLQ